MTDCDALLAAILAHPDQDLPRLAYADWLEENGQPERAEFVRVQVELVRFATFDPSHRKEFNEAARERLAKRATRLERGESESIKIARALEQGGKDYAARHDALRRRERELFVAHGKGWFGEFAVLPDSALARGEASTPRMDVVRRGFVDEVRVPTVAVWLGGDVLVRSEERGGLPGGSWAPVSGIGAEVVRRWPVTRVVVVADREPYRGDAALDAISNTLLRLAATCPACGGRGHTDAPWPMSNGCEACGSTGDARGIER